MQIFFQEYQNSSKYNFYLCLYPSISKNLFCENGSVYTILVTSSVIRGNDYDQDIMIRDELSYFYDQNYSQNVTSFNCYNKKRQLTTRFCKNVSWILIGILRILWLILRAADFVYGHSNCKHRIRKSMIKLD